MKTADAMACYFIRRAIAPSVAVSRQLFPLRNDHWSWKALVFRKTIFQAWKVMENKHNVMDFVEFLQVTAVDEQLKQKLPEVKNSKCSRVGQNVVKYL